MRLKTIFARKYPAMLFFADHVNHIIRPRYFVALGVGHQFGIVFQHRNFILRIDAPQQQRVIDILRPQVFQAAASG